MLKPGTRVCQCGACDLEFSSPSAFDLHRVGPQEERRCLTPQEMVAAGMMTNNYGQWIGAAWEPRDEVEGEDG